MMQRRFLRYLGVFYVLVSITLILDLVKFGIRIETAHKLLHVTLGVIMVYGSFKWKEASCRTFNIYNGLFFSIVAITGWLYPDLGGLDAFNRADTILHTIVGGSSLCVGLWRR